MIESLAIVALGVFSAVIGVYGLPYAREFLDHRLYTRRLDRWLDDLAQRRETR